MRSILILVALTGIAAADTDRRCEQFTNTNTPTPSLALEARVSFASCLASSRLDALALTPDVDASRAALEDAVAPAIASLDEVIAAGDPRARIIADHIKADLYVGMTVRLRNACVPLDVAVDASADRWLALADQSFADVEQVATEHPELRTNPVVAYDIDHSAQELELTRSLVGVR